MSLDSYITLGRSGLRVSPLTLGTMTFGEDAGWGSTPEDSATILAAYLDRGGNHIDTANIYTNGHSEKIIGDYFAGRNAERDRVVIGTKFFCNLHPGDPNGGGSGRKAILRQLDESLRRLQMDYVDIYWVHNWDQAAPIEETLRTLDDLVASGKVRYVGVSDLPAWKAAEAQTIAHFRGWAPAIAMQVEYSLIERTVEGELIPMAQACGLGVMPWSPLRRGLLSGRYERGDANTTRSDGAAGPDEREYRIIDVLSEVAAEVGASVAASAIAWVQGRPGVSSTLIGARHMKQLQSNIEALDVTLSAEQVARLDGISTPSLNFPAANNRDFAPMLQFAGATVDGRSNGVLPYLIGSPTRY